MFMKRNIFTLLTLLILGILISTSCQNKHDKPWIILIDKLTATPNPTISSSTMSISVTTINAQRSKLKYVWKVPDGWKITDGQGTAQIQVLSPANQDSNGTVSVDVSDQYKNYATKSINVESYSRTVNLSVEPFSGTAEAVDSGSTVREIISVSGFINPKSIKVSLNPDTPFTTTISSDGNKISIVPLGLWPTATAFSVTTSFIYTNYDRINYHRIAFTTFTTTSLPPLILAVKEHDIDKINELLSQSADINLRDNEGRSALLWAAIQGYTDTVNLLISKGAAVNAINNYDDSPLMWAAIMGHSDVVKLLLSRGADVNSANTVGDTALIWAAMRGFTDVISPLLAHGAEVNAKDSYGRTALIWAIQKKHINAVNLLLSKVADVNAKDDGGETALMLAASQGFTAAVASLITKGANANVKTENYGLTVLILAIEGQADSPEIARLLLSGGADINARDDSGNTALMVAIDYGWRHYSPDLVNLLLAKGANVNLKNKDGQTPLIIAAEQDRSYIVKLLLSKGADVNERDNKGRTALMRATSRDHRDIVKLLKEAGTTQ